MLIRKATDDIPYTHAGYYLVDDGRDALKRQLGDENPETGSFSVQPRSRLLLLNLALAILSGVVVAWLYGANRLGGSAAVCVCLAVFLVAYDYSSNLAHRIIGSRLSGRWLPTLAFVESGLSPDCRTGIAVPCLLVNKPQVDAMLDAQAWNWQVASDEHVRIVLLTDFCDSKDGVETEFERELLQYAIDRVEVFNRELGKEGVQPIMLLHRDRCFSTTQAQWIGRERKRGKIESLNQLISGDPSELRILIGEDEWIRRVRFVLCLDEDSRLCRDAIQILVGALAHPLNAAVVDTASNTISRGHALLVPILRTRASSASQWRLSSIITGLRASETGKVVSLRDFHFDYYRATHYPGKGLYEVGPYRALCDGRIPSERVLSHDTLEGAWLNPGFCGRAQVVEGFPSNQFQLEARQLRWITGDWQNLFFIVEERIGRGAGAIPALLNSIVLNQTRISLTPVALTLLVGLAVLSSALPSLRSLAAVGLLILMPLYARMLHSLLAEPTTAVREHRRLVGMLLVGHVAAICRLLRAPLDATITLRSMFLATWRTLTRRKLLQWKAASQMEVLIAGRPAESATSYFVSGIALCCAFTLLVRSDATWIAVVVLLTWASTPAYLHWTASAPASDPADRA